VMTTPDTKSLMASPEIISLDIVHYYLTSPGFFLFLRYENLQDKGLHLAQSILSFIFDSLPSSGNDFNNPCCTVTSNKFCLLSKSDGRIMGVFCFLISISDWDWGRREGETEIRDVK
jgi:hypothetical protein